MVFPDLSLLVHFENSARENDLNSSLESIIYMFWSLKHELQAVPTKYDSSTDLGHCIMPAHYNVLIHCDNTRCMCTVGVRILPIVSMIPMYIYVTIEEH